jgi:hypothetical protein
VIYIAPNIDIEAITREMFFYFDTKNF